jgi:hypothetical protein
MDSTFNPGGILAKTPKFIRRRRIQSIVVIASFAVAACATNHAHRSAALSWDGKTVYARPTNCDQPYAVTDDLIWQEMQNSQTSVSSRKDLNRRVEAIITPELGGGPTDRCWRTSYEDHQGLTRSAGNPLKTPGYDLLYAEFDDQGERTDVAHDGVDFDKSQVALIEARLGSMLQEEASPERGGGLNIVLFTHGWHGNADAADDYSIWFKAILEQIAELEANSRRKVCWSSGQQLKLGTNSVDTQTQLNKKRAFYSCSQRESQGAFKERRTVGIEVAWRGDSEVIPGLTWANFWDRKGAAQSAARGAINDLMARLHKFYQANSCRETRANAESEKPSCDTVHLLTIGHSFGALIDYHSLSDDMATGVLADGHGRAYGFGDMTVLLNPAFEGVRESTLIDASIHHPSYPNVKLAEQSEKQQEAGKWPSAAQMPTLVTMQSEGDWATHYAFPVARFFTGVFENTTGANEYSRSMQASGWIDYYQTHHLVAGPDNGKDACTYQDDQLDWYCPFDLERENTVVHPLTLYKETSHDWPAFAPLWTIKVQKSIMKNHDDISNPAVVRFIGLLFRAAYEQEEIMGERPVAHTQ